MTNLFDAVCAWLRFDNSEPPPHPQQPYSMHVNYETRKMRITEDVAKAINPRVTDTHQDGTNAYVFEPWTDGHAIGFQVTRVADNKVAYVYLNPSTDTFGHDDGVDPETLPNKGFNPDVFVYMGTTGETHSDSALHFYNIDFDNQEV